jgi:hypothetical protein
MNIGKAAREMRRIAPVCGRAAAVQQAGRRQIERARAYRAHAPRAGRIAPDPRDEFRLQRAMLIDRNAGDDQRVDRLGVK